MKNTADQNIADRRRVRGQGMTEYIIIVALIAIAAIAAVGAFGGVVKDQFTAMAQELTGEQGQDVQAVAAPAGVTTLQNWKDN